MIHANTQQSLGHRAFYRMRQLSDGCHPYENVVPSDRWNHKGTFSNVVSKIIQQSCQQYRRRICKYKEI